MKQLGNRTVPSAAAEIMNFSSASLTSAIENGDQSIRRCELPARKRYSYETVSATIASARSSAIISCDVITMKRLSSSRFSCLSPRMRPSRNTS